MFFACGMWCVADVSSVSPSTEQTNARVLRIGSGQNGPAHGSEPFGTVRQSAGIWKVVAEKNVLARLAPGQNQFFWADQNVQWKRL